MRLDRGETIAPAPTLASVASVALLAACAAPPGFPAPRALAYGLEVPGVAEYVVGDSARAEILAAGQRFALNASVGERWRMEFAPSDGGTRVTATLTDLDARLTNPISPPQTADESAVTGPVIFHLDRRGRATVEALPDVKPAVAQFLSGSGVAHTFFPRLPGRAVAPGDRWTDTVAYAASEGGADMDVRAVTTYTVAGDSVADGASYLLIRSEGTTEQSSAGNIAGTEFSQDVSGPTNGYILWDGRDGVMHALELRSDLTGAMAASVAPVALEVRVRSVVRVRRTAPR
jgi:hypothetical protein